MRMIDRIIELERRVAELDADSPPYLKTLENSCNGLAHFIEVMSRITSAGISTDLREYPCISSEIADKTLKSCRLLDRLEATVPEIVSEPLRMNSQWWVGTGNVSYLPKAKLTLSKSHFKDVSVAQNMKPSTKPFFVGLYTSTSVFNTYGMWRMYLDLNRGSSLNPLPWQTWAVEICEGARVREISSATDWVKFVLSYHRFERGLIFPDWKLVAHDYDAIHMTLRAIVAIQGFFFSTEQGTIANTFWDIESTFWLRWCFQSVKLVETVE